MLSTSAHIYILSTIFFTVYSQLVIRWQMSEVGPLPPGILEKIQFIAALFLNPWILSSVLATFLAGVSWMLAMMRFEISYAYPWVSLNFVIILLLAILFLGESYTHLKLLGTVLIMMGIILVARGG